MKFVVAQIGARRGYAVPAILEKAGMLERFYTDVTGDFKPIALLSAAGALPIAGEPTRRLAARRLPKEIRSKTATFPGLTLGHLLRQRFLSRRSDPIATYRESLRFSRSLGRAMARSGFCDATHVYSMLGECGPLLPSAKQRGLTVVTELYIPLSTEGILAEERRRFPGWEPSVPNFGAIRREAGVDDTMLKFTDYFICPSEMAREDLIANWGVKRERTVLVPYGMSPHWLEVEAHPTRGRVLFAGTAELRKGIHYFARAAEILVARGLRYEFRVAGNVQPAIANQRQCSHLKFLGRVPRAEMESEFAAADILVMPSLSETGPEVNYEALACGVPVVTTPEAKAVVRDDIDGQIIPSRDPDALAEAIVAIVEDRERRDRMSYAARERARCYTWERYGERLVAALKGFPTPKSEPASA